MFNKSLVVLSVILLIIGSVICDSKNSKPSNGGDKPPQKPAAQAPPAPAGPSSPLDKQAVLNSFLERQRNNAVKDAVKEKLSNQEIESRIGEAGSNPIADLLSAVIGLLSQLLGGNKPAPPCLNIGQMVITKFTKDTKLTLHVRMSN